jgi:hypothetical protein
VFASPSEIFVHDYETLKGVLNNPTKMNLIAGSLPLRRQLLEQQIHGVVRQSGQKLLFRVSPESPSSTFAASSGLVLWSCLSPIDGGTFEMTSIQAFLARTAVKLPNTTFNVKDTITFLANKSGGVHSGLAKKDNELEFVWLGKTFGIGGMPSFAFIFIDIIKVFINSTDSLYQFARTSITND